VTLLNLEALSARLGTRLDAATLRQALQSGNLAFDRDGPCELLGDETRRMLQERALAAAQRQGFAPYAELFAASPPAGGSPAPLGPEELGDEDLRRLALASAAP